ncbi:DUF5683 domain-containing protein [Winogradskyella sediminis]|uniref:DUF5683 domain-containing protein n=1 Tax=Winogradskyella sediminis TaxID=1382466 RepID=A0A1H1VN47_9FLAO|nr:DUF5683 domain-containing protein [Winogradskyella sediminis]REG87776.1 hypothetical protein C8N41_102621 [Winogradskyella sediminis]SDS86242.1 hypothetical protein SAMN04489797_2607 [Winogradskyella sediminis]
MTNRSFYSFLIGLLSVFFSFAQIEKDSTSIAIEESPIIANETLVKKEIDPLRPSKAAFYSAVLPGLGQAYNKKYWKIPIVWGAIGTGIYFYVRNDKQFDRYRDAYKRRLAGFKDDEFYNLISDDGLIRAQEQFRRNKEMSMLITIGLYALNILDANIDAHLLQFNVDENLSLSPHYQYNELENSSDLGLTLNFKF